MLVVAVTGQLGDLLESMIKRDAGSKDSASMVPEFGGLLDLLDSVVVAAPFAWAYLHLADLNPSGKMSACVCSTGSCCFGIMELKVKLQHPHKRVGLLGLAEENLRLLRDTCGVTVVSRNDQITLGGAREEVTQAADILQQMQHWMTSHDTLSRNDMRHLLRTSLQTRENHHYDAVDIYVPGKRVAPRTSGQAAYVKAIEKHDLVFCTGPAGTGKTYLAVAMAVSMLKRNQIRRIALARPAVEAGERLGFLPGDLQDKVNPYLRPLFDALGDMMDYSQIKRFLFNDIIEVIPLAFMRGRTFNESIIILDEAQNTTPTQMLMFLTRLGNDSKMIVTGDDQSKRSARRPVVWPDRRQTPPERYRKNRVYPTWPNMISYGIVWCRILSGPMKKPACPHRRALCALWQYQSENHGKKEE